jgi:hypothetical protein
LQRHDTKRIQRCDFDCLPEERILKQEPVVVIKADKLRRGEQIGFEEA